MIKHPSLRSYIESNAYNATKDSLNKLFLEKYENITTEIPSDSYSNYVADPGTVVKSSYPDARKMIVLSTHHTPLAIYQRYPNVPAYAVDAPLALYTLLQLQNMHDISIQDLLFILGSSKSCTDNIIIRLNTYNSSI
jgi:hypothetical protein